MPTNNDPNDHQQVEHPIGAEMDDQVDRVLDPSIIKLLDRWYSSRICNWSLGKWVPKGKQTLQEPTSRRCRRRSTGRERKAACSV